MNLPKSASLERPLVRDACQRLIDDLAYLEATTGEVLGVLTAQLAVLGRGDLDAAAKVAAVEELLRDADTAPLAVEMPAALHDAVSAVDEISRAVMPRRSRPRLAPVVAPDVVGEGRHR